jgi:FG-GAP repeat/FG-GAP-like repeat
MTLPTARRVVSLSSVVLAVVAGFSSPVLASGFKAHRLWSFRGDQQEGAKFGAAAASAGDVNGDGRPDLIVGAPTHDGAAGPACGKVFVFYNSAAGLPSTPSWTAEGEQPGSRFGEAVASAGDVNGDGFDDVIVGSPGFIGYDPFYPIVIYRGRIYVYYGSAQGLLPTPAFSAYGGEEVSVFKDGLGGAVASGDFNGDGYADIVAAQRTRWNGGASVYYGSAEGPSPRISWRGGGSWQGHSLAIGHVNGDGYDDLIIASQSEEIGNLNPWALLTFGSPTGLVPLGPEGPAPELTFFWSDAVIADLDQDGFSDLVTIRHEFHPDQFVPHHALYRGSATGHNKIDDLGGVFDTYGRLELIGDLNGDGFPDFIAQDGATFFLYFGSTSLVRSLPDGVGTLSGIVTGARDVDGDGFDDIVVGDATNERVDVYRGGRDWSFPATADVSVAQTPWHDGDATFIETIVTNAGRETMRVRLVDHFPPAIASAGWYCGRRDGSVAAACMTQTYLGGSIGDIDAVITLGPGGSIVFYVSVGVVSLPVVNTASIVLPDGVVDPDLSNNQSTVPLGPPLPGIFADSFESGGLSAWSSHSARGLAVLAEAALEGQKGLAVTLPRSGAAVVHDDTPSNEGTYNARFRFDPNGFGTLGIEPNGAGNTTAGRVYRTVLFSGGSPFELVLEVEDGKLFLVGHAAGAGTSRATITDAPHVIEVAWQRATAWDAIDGRFELQIDGAPAGSLLGLGDGGGVESVELGLALGANRPPPSPHRTVFLDSFESWRFR